MSPSGHQVEEKGAALQQISAGGLPDAAPVPSEGGEVEFEVNVHNTSTPTDSRQNLKIESIEEITVVTGNDSSVQYANSSLVSEVI